MPLGDLSDQRIVEDQFGPELAVGLNPGNGWCRFSCPGLVSLASIRSGSAEASRGCHRPPGRGR